jgi:oligopeptide/dipeptide ABC transporter ATP-binding protein
MTPLLEMRNVTKIFSSGLIKHEQTIALENFSFSMSDDTPSVTSVVGESGSGKTTLVRLMLGLLHPTEGEVLYRGKNLRTLSRPERRTFLREVQTVFQDPFEVYNPFYRVDHVLELPITNFGLAGSKSDRRKLMELSLSAVGLRPEETLGRYPHQLSGGQRQRIMVARALMLRPRIIIADEPVSMVDASLRATILESLLSLNRDFGISLIYITHDLTTAYQVSEDVIVLYRGAVVEAGSAELVVQQPEHPYTRLLVSSIPLPDPDIEWQGERVLGTPVGGLTPTGDRFCRFHERCPYAMQQCVDADPPFYRTAQRRATACYLFQQSPEAPAGDLNTVLSHETAQVVPASD